MQVVAIEGAAPGNVVATVRHGASVRKLRVEVAQHPLGGWQARRARRRWNLRCSALSAAILMEAAETFAAA
jgi:hypothetical protein